MKGWQGRGDRWRSREREREREVREIYSSIYLSIDKERGREQMIP
jgi:hypothetical protein